MINVAAAVMVLLAPRGRIPKDRGWKAARVFMGKVKALLCMTITHPVLYDSCKCNPQPALDPQTPLTWYSVMNTPCYESTSVEENIKYMSHEIEMEILGNG